MDEFTPIPDQIIEEALEERPYATLPPAFVGRVMARIEASQVTRQVIRYRLELLDLALPILVACLVVLGLGLTGRFAFLGIATPINWSAVLPAALLSLPTRGLSANWNSLVGLLAFAEICLVGLFCVWFWLDRPLPPTNGQA
jgi:hypothetical protein